MAGRGTDSELARLVRIIQTLQSHLEFSGSVARPSKSLADLEEPPAETRLVSPAPLPNTAA